MEDYVMEDIVMKDIDFVGIERKMLAKKYPGFTISPLYNKAGEVKSYKVHKTISVSTIDSKEREDAIIEFDSNADNY